MTWDVLVRTRAGDVPVGSVTHHYDPPTGGAVDAVQFETDLDGPAVAAKYGDLLVLRITGAAGSSGTAFVPNSDGANAKGRIPSLKLP